MKNIPNEQLKDYIVGAERIDCDGEYLTFYRISEEQQSLFDTPFRYTNTAGDDFSEFFHIRTIASSSITLDFETDAQNFSFDYKLIRRLSTDTLDIYVDCNYYRAVTLPLDSETGKVRIDLPVGKKRVKIYFPNEAQTCIKNFKVDGELSPIEIEGEKVLFYGDSITQGYGVANSSCSYVNTCTRLMNYSVINQGVSGYYFDADFIVPLKNFTPDKIVVALGTNGSAIPGFVDERVVKYFKKLQEVFGDTPVLAITPVWRGDLDDYTVFNKTVEIIKAECAKYKNVTVIDGFALIPNQNDFFADKLHPNSFGAVTYGINLANIIKKLNF